MEEEVPNLLSFVPSDNATSIFENIVVDGEINESDDDENYLMTKLPYEWRVEVKFTKKLRERDLWDAFSYIFEQRL